MKKVIVITGGDSGLGFETARVLAKDTSNILLLGCPDEDSAQVAVKKLQAVSGNTNIQSLALDLASFASVRRFAADIIRIAPKIDVLACNAGIQIGHGTQLTTEGVEKTFGVNHLGHFLLTKLLLPFIDTTTGRIVPVSSGTHFNPAIWQSALFGIPAADYTGWQSVAAPDSFKDYPEKSRGYVRYSTSKLCIVLFGYALNRKLRERGSGIMVNIFDPGLMPGTGLARESAAMAYWAWKNLMPVMRIFNGVYSVKTSAAAYSKLLTAPGFNDITGKYFEGLKEKRSSIHSYDTQLWEDLWKGSEQLIGEPFNVDQ